MRASSTTVGVSVLISLSATPRAASITCALSIGQPRTKARRGLQRVGVLHGSRTSAPDLNPLLPGAIRRRGSADSQRTAEADRAACRHSSWGPSSRTVSSPARSVTDRSRRRVAVYASQGRCDRALERDLSGQADRTDAVGLEEFSEQCCDVQGSTLDDRRPAVLQDAAWRRAGPPTPGPGSSRGRRSLLNATENDAKRRASPARAGGRGAGGRGRGRPTRTTAPQATERRLRARPARALRIVTPGN